MSSKSNRPGRRERLIAFLRRVTRPPRRILPTRAGLLTLGAPFVLGVAAINASNNLLFLLLGACLGLIVLSGLLSERGIAGIDVELRSAGPAYVGAPARIAAVFRRTRHRAGTAPAFALRVRERRMSRRRLSPGRRLDLRMPIVEGATGTAIGTRIFDQRGLVALEPCEILTTYPFGLLTKARDLDAECTVLVRPREVPVPEALADPRGVAGEGPTSTERGPGTDLYGLRERDERDHHRRVHALRSARLGKEVVVETEAQHRPVALLAVANLAGAEPEALERCLEIAQATIREWDLRGFAVGLRTAALYLAPGSTSLEAMLDTLARVALEERAIAAEGGGLWLVPKGAPAPPADEVAAMVEVGATGALTFILPQGIAA